MGIKQRIEEDIFGAQRKREETSYVATVLNAYYEKSTDGNANILLDVVQIDEDGTTHGMKSGVPLVKLGGLAQALPPIGSLACIMSIGGNPENPVCLGYLESGITTKYISDDKTPTAPPQVLIK